MRIENICENSAPNETRPPPGGADSLPQSKTGGLWRRIVMNKWVYILFLPALIYFAVFSYSCYYGIVIAFKDYKPFVGIVESEWVGLKHFRYILQDRNFTRLLWNTVKISVLRILVAFPVPIVFALLMNEVKNMRFKKSRTDDYLLPELYFMGCVCGDCLHVHRAERRNQPGA